MLLCAQAVRDHCPLSISVTVMQNMSESGTDYMWVKWAVRVRHRAGCPLSTTSQEKLRQQLGKKAVHCLPHWWPLTRNVFARPCILPGDSSLHHCTLFLSERRDSQLSLSRWLSAFISPLCPCSQRSRGERMWMLQRTVPVGLQSIESLFIGRVRRCTGNRLTRGGRGGKWFCKLEIELCNCEEQATVQVKNNNIFWYK